MKKILFVLCGLLIIILPIPRRGGAETPTPTPEMTEAEVLAAKQASYPAWVGDEVRYLPGWESPIDDASVAPTGPDTANDWTGIVMQKYTNGSWEIFKAQGYSTNFPLPKTQLTFTGGADIYPRYNRGATKIVFATYRDGNFEIYTMDPNGGSLARLTVNGAIESQPQWSADGSKIVFVSDRDGNAEIYVMNSDGSGQTRLTNFPNTDVYPTMSPDGNQIAWLQVLEYGASVWVMNVDGTNQYAIAPWYGYAQHLTWSPDGQWLAWDADFTGDSWNEIARIKPDGTGLQQISGSGANLYDIWMSSWLMDSQKILQNGISYFVYDDQLYFNQTALSVLFLNGETPYVIDTSSGSAISLNYDAQSLDVQAPVSEVQPLPLYSRANGFSVNWIGIDTGLSGFWYMDVQSRIGSSGNWTNWQTYSQPGSETFVGNPGNTVYFRSQALDNAENLEEWPAGNGNVFTTLYKWLLQGQVFDNRGISLPSPLVNVSPQAINSDAVGLDGSFIRYNAVTTTTFTVSQPGYEAAPTTELVGDQDKNYFWVFSPTDNQVLNGDFETGNLNAWQLSGAFLSTLTTETYHTGEDAVRIGQDSLAGSAANISNTDWGSVNPQIVRTPDNVLHAVWVDSTDIPGDPSPFISDIFYSTKTPGLAWTSPVIISPAHQNNAYFPYIEVGADGTMHLVWIESVSTYGLGELKYAFKALGENWTAPVVIDQISDAWYFIDTPIIAIDSLGGFHVAWTPGDDSIYYLYKPQGGSWTSSLQLDYGSGYLSMAIDNNDRIYVIWAAEDLYYMSKPLGGNWEPVQIIGQDAGYYSFAQPDPAGGIHIFWNSGSPKSYEGYYMHLNSNGNITSTFLVSTSSTTSTSYPTTMMLGPDGTLHLCWREADLATGKSKVYYRIRFSSGDWSSPMLLTHSDVSESIYNIDFWADTDGKLQIVWNAWVNPNEPLYEIYYVETNPIQAAWASLSQTITLDPNTHKPTLSFAHFLSTSSNWDSSPAFEVRLNQTVVFSTTAETEDWTHSWLDLSPWLSQTVTITFKTNYNPNYGLAYVYLDDISLGSWLTPVPTAVDLTHIPLPSGPVQITITGENFIATPTVKLNDTLLQNVQWIDENTLQATVPANLPPGRYNLWVTNPGGQTSVLPNAIIVGNEIFLPLIAR